MTHILISSYADGRIAAAKPVIARTDEELALKKHNFTQITREEGIGDYVSFLTEEDLVLIQNLDVDELFDSGE